MNTCQKSVFNLKDKDLKIPLRETDDGKYKEMLKDNIEPILFILHLYMCSNVFASTIRK